jgi:Holliday junction resolvase RusA-like endonuclease
MKLNYSSTKFKKSVPIDKWPAIDKLMESFKLLEKLHLSANYEAVRSFLDSKQSKKFRGSDNLFKFRAGNDGARIVFAYHPARDEIFFVEYISGGRHDAQGRIVKHKEYLSAIVSVSGEPRNDLGLDEDDEEDEHFSRKSYNPNSDIVFQFPESGKITRESIDPVRLSDDQNECFRKKSPLLITGSAGSGKSIVAIHFLHHLYINSTTKLRKLYLTLLPGLVDTAEKQFCEAAGIDKVDDIGFEFSDIESFCLRELGKRATQYISFAKFQTAFYGGRYRKYSAIDVWTEIRGVIKGRMDEDWRYIGSFQQRDYSKAIPFIEKHIAQQGSREFVPDKTYSKGANEWDKSISKAKKENEQAAEELAKLKLRYQFGFDKEKKHLAYDEYLKLGEEFSPYDEAEKLEIFGIFMDYQNWLAQNGCYDDNDLASEMALRMLELGGNLPFDCVCIDEIQDLTEKQLFMATQLISLPSGQLVLSGDEHQIINPTVFSLKRTKMLFHSIDFPLKSDNILILNRNYRSQSKIISISNRLSQKRRVLIGSGKIENEIEEEAVRDGILPIVFKPTSRNLDEVFKSLMDIANSAIIVGNDQQADELGRKYPDEKDRIYTIFEAKGLEFGNVFLYAMVGNNLDAWNEILSGNVKHKTRFRFYFNTFYVGITRAMDHLCIIEDKIPQDLEKLMEGCIRREAVFSSADVASEQEFDAETDWREEGKKLERLGHYGRAIICYERGKASAATIHCCKGKDCEYRGKYDAAAISFLLASDVEGAVRNGGQSTNPKIMSIVDNLSKVVREEPNQQDAHAISNHFLEIFGEEDAPDALIVFVELFAKSIHSLSLSIRGKQHGTY